MSAQSVSVRIAAIAPSASKPRAGLRLIELVLLVAALLALGAVLIPLPATEVEPSTAATTSAR